MAISKIQNGTEIKNKSGMVGVISKIITKSTGYIEVNYNGSFKKEMAFNLTDINGESLKAKPKPQFHTVESAAKFNASIDAFHKKVSDAEYFEHKF